MEGQRRFAASVLATLVAAGVIASCSDAAGPDTAGTPDDGSTVVLGALQGGGWTPAVENAGRKAGKIDVCHSGSGGTFQRISVSANATRAHLGNPETGEGGHPNDYRVSDLTPCPPPDEPGLVQVCKVAGNGIATGTSYTYTLTTATGQESTVTVTAGAAPSGTCADAGSFRVGTEVRVQEAAQADMKVTGLVVTPAGAQVGTSDLTGRRATLVVGIGTTTATFTNTSTVAGSVVVCKVAGAGVAEGTSFSFTVGTQATSVAAGAGPAGTCASPMVATAGNVTVTEAAAAGTSVSAVTATMTGSGTALVSSDLPARTATVNVMAGELTTVTFTNTGPTGTLVICKIGGAGVAAGTNFTFTVGGQTQTVASGAAPGTCGAPLTLAAGPATVTETAVAGTSVQSITGTPTPTNVNLATRTATTQITAGQESRITFTNVAP